MRIMIIRYISICNREKDSDEYTGFRWKWIFRQ